MAVHGLEHLKRISRIAKIKSELQEIYLTQILKTFAIALIGIFVPIYLLNLGIDLRTIYVFIMLIWLSFASFSPFSAMFASKKGFKHVILYHSPIVLLFYFLLAAFPFFESISMLFIISIIGGIAGSMYWVSLNTEFVLHSHKQDRGKEVSHLVALPRIATIIAPLIGAVFIEVLGFEYLFGIVIFLLFLSAAPLFATKDYAKPFRISFLFKQRTKFSKHISVRPFIQGIVLLSEGVLWPIYVYLMSDLLFLGFAAMLVGFGTVLFTLAVGRLSDRFDREKILKICGVLFAMVWIFRIYATNAMEFAILSFFGGLGFAAIDVCVFADFCDYVRRRRNILTNIVWREIALSIGRLLILFFIFLTSFRQAFALAALASFLLMIV